MILSRELGKRIWGGSTNMENGGGGISSDAIAGLLTGYAKESWVDEHYISIDFFSRLFQAHGTENESEIDVMPNDMETTITSVESMFGFWTNLYISALGSNGAAPAGISLGMLTDVTISGTPSAGQVLTFDAVSGKWVNGNAQAGATALANLTDVTLTTPTYGQFFYYDGTKWANIALKTINSQSLIGSGDISVGGGASGNYLPLAGGTMTGAIEYSGANHNILITSNNDSNWFGGLKYSWSSNTTIAFWCKDNRGQFVWHAGTNFINTDVDGTTNKNYDFQIGRESNVLNVRTTGNINAVGYGKFGVIWIGSRNNGTTSGATDVIESNAGTHIFLQYFNSGRINMCNGGGSVLIGTDGSYPAKFNVNGTSSFNSGAKFNNICIEVDNSITFGNRNSEINNYTEELCLQHNTNKNLVCCFGGGSMAIGVGSPSYKLHVAGTIYATGAITALSDARKKDITGEAEVSVEQIAHAPAVQFLWKDKERRKDGQQVGTLAQYWQTVLPEVVMDKGDELSMQYGVAALVSAITIARKVVDHEHRITELEKENERLRTEIEQLRLN